MIPRLTQAAPPDSRAATKRLPCGRFFVGTGAVLATGVELRCFSVT
jgi:hypothetical protein